MAEVVFSSEPGMHSELHGSHPELRIKGPPEYMRLDSGTSNILIPWRKSMFLFVAADLPVCVLLPGLRVMACAAKYWSAGMAL